MPSAPAAKSVTEEMGLAQRQNAGDASVERRVEDLLQRMTLKEKVSLLSGVDTWHTAPIERLGIPSLTMTDGPHGVRATKPEAGRKASPATSFPTGVSMAASWDPGLIERVGAALAEETQALGCDILLGPCVNIARTPLAGRNFESYAEDPYLAGRIAVAYIKGLQGAGVGASIKHFACNNQENERFRGNSVVDERTLREIYLPAFEAAVKEAAPRTVMCSYNRINGVYASQNRHVLTEILKEEWGFEGAVISDWGANHTTIESVAGGLDLEMPGPPHYYGRLLADAVSNWQLDEAAVDEAARRVLRLIVLSGRMDGRVAKGSLNTPAHQALARELAAESITLLKNERAALPLRPERLKSIAVIGPNAAEARIGGGGSAHLEPPYRISPLQALEARLAGRIAIGYEPGCDNYVEPPILKTDYLELPNGGGHGLLGEYFARPDLAGEPALVRHDPRLDFWWWHDSPGEGLDGGEFSARWTGTLTPTETGRHAFMFMNTGTARLYLDGALILESTRGERQDWHEVRTLGEAELAAGRRYDVRVEYVKNRAEDLALLRLFFAYHPRPEEDGRPERAVRLAAASDAALIFAGMPEGYETEGRDRPDLELPGGQNGLIAAVAAANPNTIVVLNTGAPVTMPWLDKVAAVVEAYYPGLEAGNAVADVLLGAVNPSGRLPVTFPRRLCETPAFLNTTGDREVRYGEGIFVGYRWYDAREIEPLFPFGHGLSYTTFAYGGLEAPARAKIGDPVRLSVAVRNTGAAAGKEVVQVYIRDVESSLPRPPKELKAFAKVSLAPGEEKKVEFTLERRAFAFYDPVAKDWVVEPGEFEILVGSSSRDIRGAVRIVLETM
ncbi:MAG: glycoside hydrolase family 3 C-terminal domain-containing protein [Patescibacteria group bacterium]